MLKLEDIPEGGLVHNKSRKRNRPDYLLVENRFAAKPMKRQKFKGNYRIFNRNNRSAYAKAGYALRLVRKLKKEVETKDKVIGFTGTTDASLVYKILLSGIGEGTDDEDRIGRKISASWLTLNAMLTLDISTATAGCAVKCVVVQHRNSKGTEPNWNDIFVGTNAINGVLKREGQQGNFGILASKTFQIKNTCGTVPLKLYLKLNNRKIHFKGTGDTYAHIEKGGIWFFALATVTGGTQVSISGQARLAFQDS